jgi:light-regulated signal transduction histidine kinase (bacteriophytochrome)
MHFLSITEIQKISISNSGFGISKDELKISYLILSIYNCKQTKETGIGLVITNEFFDIHRGKIELNSRPNERTNFFYYNASYKSCLLRRRKNTYRI